MNGRRVPQWFVMKLPLSALYVCNIGSVNELVPPDTKSIPDSLLAYIYALIPWVCNYEWEESFTVICDHDDVIKWKHFPRYWPFVRRIHRSPVNSPHKGQWRGALMFSLICTRINDWVNNREAGDLRRHQAHCDVIVMDEVAFGFLICV